MLALAVGVLAGCAGSSVSRPTDPALAKGQDLYNARCAACHGLRGEGGTGKRLNGGAVRRDLPDPAAHRRLVEQGVAGTAMPAWAGVLEPDEIDAIVRYEREVLDGLG